MLSRRDAKVLGVVGLTFLVGGIASIGISPLPIHFDGTITVAPSSAGPSRHEVFTWSVLAGGHLNGSFAVRDHTAMTMYILDGDQYLNYLEGGGLTWSEFHVSAFGAQFSVALPDRDSYHVVFVNESALSDEEVELHVIASGVNPYYVGAGVASAFGGAILSTIAIRRIREPPPGPAPNWILKEPPT